MNMPFSFSGERRLLREFDQNPENMQMESPDHLEAKESTDAKRTTEQIDTPELIDELVRGEQAKLIEEGDAKMQQHRERMDRHEQRLQVVSAELKTEFKSGDSSEKTDSVAEVADAFMTQGLGELADSRTFETPEKPKQETSAIDVHEESAVTTEKGVDDALRTEAASAESVEDQRQARSA